MTVNHCSRVNVSTDIHKHRRHTDHSRRDIRTVAYARSARHNPYIVTQTEGASRVSILFKEAPLCIHLRERPHAKAEQDSTLHPNVGAPSTRLVTFGGAHLATIKRRFELLPQRAIFRRVFSLVRRYERLYSLPQCHPIFLSYNSAYDTASASAQPIK